MQARMHQHVALLLHDLQHLVARNLAEEPHPIGDAEPLGERLERTFGRTTTDDPVLVRMIIAARERLDAEMETFPRDEAGNADEPDARTRARRRTAAERHDLALGECDLRTDFDRRHSQPSHAFGGLQRGGDAERDPLRHQAQQWIVLAEETSDLADGFQQRAEEAEPAPELTRRRLTATHRPPHERDAEQRQETRRPVPADSDVVREVEPDLPMQGACGEIGSDLPAIVLYLVADPAGFHQRPQPFRPVKENELQRW